MRKALDREICAEREQANLEDAAEGFEAHPFAQILTNEHADEAGDEGK